MKDTIPNTFHCMNKSLNLTMAIILYALWISLNQSTFPWMFPNEKGAEILDLNANKIRRSDCLSMIVILLSAGVE